MDAHAVSRALRLETGRRTRVFLAQHGKRSLEQCRVDLQNGMPGPCLNLIRLKRDRQIEGGGFRVSARFERHSEPGGIRLIDDLPVRRFYRELNARVIRKEDNPA